MFTTNISLEKFSKRALPSAFYLGLFKCLGLRFVTGRTETIKSRVFGHPNVVCLKETILCQGMVDERIKIAESVFLHFQGKPGRKVIERTAEVD